MDTPHLFISYSHDSPEHSKWVQDLARDLRRNGADAFLDVWDIRPGEIFTKRIEKEVAAADHCIVVCTPRYREVAEKRRSEGVGYEATLIRDAFRERSKKHPWVLPILREGTGRDALPDWLVDRAYLDWRDDTAYEQHLEELLRAIFSSRRKPSRPPEFPSRPESSHKTKVTLTINANIDTFDDAKLERLGELLKTYLGEGITITEKKSG